MFEDFNLEACIFFCFMWGVIIIFICYSFHCFYYFLKNRRCPKCKGVVNKGFNPALGEEMAYRYCPRCDIFCDFE
jgi:hypothetical protein